MNNKTQHTKYQIPNTKPKKRRKIWILPLPIAIAVIIIFIAGGGALIYALTKTTEKAGPVGYWKLDEGAGTVAYDASGNNNSGTLTNFDFNDNSNWTNGKVAGALKFDGTNDYVDCGISTSLDITDVITIEVWVKRSDLNRGQSILHKGIAGQGYDLFIKGSDNAIRFTRLGVKDYDSNATITDTNNWHHITIVENSSYAVSFYLDGAYQDTVTHNAGGISSGQILSIGGYDSYYFKGAIDEVRIYNRALSAAEVQWDYNRGGPVGYWKFDEGSGGSVSDSSGNGNTGTWSGTGTHWAPGKINGAGQFASTTSDYVNCGDMVDVGTSDFSVEAWVNPALVTYYMRIVDKGSYGWGIAPGAEGYALTSGYGKFLFVVKDADEQIYVEGNADFSASIWYHVAGTADRDGLLKFYINGVLQNDQKNISTVGNLDNTNPLRMGTASNQADYQSWDGLIDDVRIYNYARSAAEIRTDYNAGFAVRFGGSYDLTQGLVGYWDFDEGAGTAAYDGSTNGNNGALTNFDFNDNSNWTTGKVAGALKFDGSNDYIQIPYSSAFDSNQITLAAWVYIDGTPTVNRKIIAKSRDSESVGGSTWQIRADEFNPNNLLYQTKNGETWQTASTSDYFSGTGWYYVAITHNSITDEVVIYRNGVSVSYTGSITQDFDFATDDLYIGAREISGTGADCWNGFIDDVRIYNRALSADEIRYLYNRKGPVGWWKFDEGSGSTAYDSSGNGNNGTIYNATSASGKINSALNFDGDGDYVSVSDSSTLNITKEITVSAWIKNRDSINYGNGSDGNLTVSSGTTTLDTDANPDGFDYVNVSVSAGAVLTAAGSNPLIIRATGNVIIEGTLQVDGGDGQDSNGGGYTPAGGTGIAGGSNGAEGLLLPGQNNSSGNHGYGVGRGYGGYTSCCACGGGDCGGGGGGGSYGTNGTSGGTCPLGSQVPPYSDPGSIYLGAQFGGSGGGSGGYDEDGGQMEAGAGGGAGGGALKISSPTITISGVTRADGGDGGDALNANEGEGGSGGGGSGGGIWLVASSINISGSLTALGGSGGIDYTCGSGDTSGGNGGKGRIKLDYNTLANTGTIDPSPSVEGIYPLIESKGGSYGMGSDRTYVYSYIGSHEVRTTADTSEWTHLTLTYDGSTEKLYINGILKASESFSQSILTNDYSFYIGGGGGALFLDGIVDDVRIYNYARTAAEIRTDYNAGFAVRFGGSYDLTQGLVGYWNFGEGSGSVAYDATENNNDGTLTNFDFNSSSGWTTGNAAANTGSALKFDGSNDYVDVADATSLEPSALTISFWLKLNTIPDMGILGKQFPLDVIWNITNGYLIRTNMPNEIMLIVGTGTSQVAISASSFATSTWYFVTATHDGSNIRLYKDGVLVAGPTSASPISYTDSGNLAIGRESGGTAGAHNGLIDEVRIYNRALSADEIRYLYNRKQPIAHWKFDEGAGQYAYDSSINGNIGTLGSTTAADVADPTWTEGYINRALSFDGNDYVNCGTSGLNPNSKTIIAWFKASSLPASYHCIIGKMRHGGANDYQGYELVTNGSILSGHVCDGTQNYVDISKSGLVVDTWYHAALVHDYDNSKLYLYLNGEEVGETNINGFTGYGSYLAVGRESDYDYYYFNGLIDDVRIYNYARTAAEIRADYNAGMSTYFK